MKKYFAMTGMLMISCAFSFLLKATEQPQGQGPEELEVKAEDARVHEALPVHAPIKVYETSAGFPKTLGGLIFKEYLPGGSGGVLVLKDPTGKRYTLKGSAETDHIKEEIMADGLYHALGVPVPSFAIYTQVPDHLIPDHLKQNFVQGPYRLAEFVEGHAPHEEVKGDESTVNSFFVADAFLANRDVKEENILFNRDGIPVRIDNGGALRYRSVGGRKGEGNDSWDLNRIPELATFRSSMGIAQSSYSRLSFEDVKRQALDILGKSNQLLDAFKNLSSALDMRRPQELEQMLTARLNLLSSVVRPGSFGIAKADSPVSDYTAAGVFVHAIDPNDQQVKVLLGKRIGHDYWGQLGGKSDAKLTPAHPIPDRSLAETAARETREESMTLFSFVSRDVEHMPSHDLIRIEVPDDPETPGRPDIRRYANVFRMYFAQHAFIPAQTFKEKLRGAAGAEYTDFRWVPVSAFLNMTAANHVTIDGQTIPIHPPFADMLRQGSVYRMLRAINDKKALPGQHTEGLAGVKDLFVPTTIKMKDATTRQYIQHAREGQKGETYEEKIFSEPQREERALAEGVSKMGSVVGDIKQLPQGKGRMGVKEAVTHVQEPQPLPLALPAQMPYTQTEGHMKVVLGDQFERITGHDEATIRAQIRNNILKVLNTKVKDSYQMTADNSYVDQLTDVALEERRHPHQYVFYHGTDNDVGFLYDVITEFRKQLMASTHPDTVMLRGIDQAFTELFKETGAEGVAGLIKKFTQKKGLMPNYQGNYQDLAISANAFLFGSLGVVGSETFQYFFDAHSVAPPDMQKFFNHFAAQLGLPLNFRRYAPLLRDSSACGDTKNGRLYQIFIEPEYVDDMAHAAVSFGAELRMPENLGKDAPVSSKIKHILDDMRENPGYFSQQEEEKDQEVSSGGYKNLHEDYKNFQARLFVKPEWMMDPHIVQIKRYWRCSALQAAYLKQLRELVREDLTHYLLSHREPKKEALAPGPTTTLLHQYKAAYERTTGQKYVSSHQEPQEELTELIEQDDAKGLEAWVKQHGPALLTEPFPKTDYRSNNKKNLTPLKLASEKQKFKVALYIWQKISPSISVDTTKTILNLLSAPRIMKDLDPYLKESGDFVNALLEKILENSNKPTVVEKINDCMKNLPLKWRLILLYRLNTLTSFKASLKEKSLSENIEKVINQRREFEGQGSTLFSEFYNSGQPDLGWIRWFVDQGAIVGAQLIYEMIQTKPVDMEFLMSLINHLAEGQVNIPVELHDEESHQETLLGSVIGSHLLGEQKLILIQALVEKGAIVDAQHIYNIIKKIKPVDMKPIILLINRLTEEKVNVVIDSVFGKTTLLKVVTHPNFLKPEERLILLQALVKKGGIIDAEVIYNIIHINPVDTEFVISLINRLAEGQLNAVIASGSEKITLLESVTDPYFLKPKERLKPQERSSLVQALVKKGAIVNARSINYTIRKPVDMELVMFLIDHSTSEQLNTLIPWAEGYQAHLLESVIGEGLLDEEKWILMKALVGRGAMADAQLIYRTIKNKPVDMKLVMFLIDHSTRDQLNAPIELRDGKKITLLESVVDMPRLDLRERLHLVEKLLKYGAEVNQNMIEQRQGRIPQDIMNSLKAAFKLPVNLYKLPSGVIKLFAALEKPANTNELKKMETPVYKYYEVPRGGYVIVPEGTEVASDLVKQLEAPKGHDLYHRP